MKTALLFLCLLGAGTAGHAQRRLEIVCEVADAQVNYGRAEHYLPDSLHSLFVRPKRGVLIYGPDLVNVLTLYGWKFVGASPGLHEARYSNKPTVYYLKREVLLSEEAYVEMQHRIEAALNGKQ
ncbi:hypothetical protein [Flaviaesturariibacter amylovorans]|uniref:Uncharacterized protein n=1 Tax=Flaviaesturariibacter amylovorans TaxID=1084520 RepID=A0ABP8G4Z5_9BACT